MAHNYYTDTDHNGNRVTDIGDPTADGDAVSRGWVTDTYVPLDGETMTGPLLFDFVAGAQLVPRATYAITNANSLAAYPVGISLYVVQSGNGFPAAAGGLLTINVDGGITAWQILGGADSFYYRRANGDGSWRAWRTIS